MLVTQSNSAAVKSLSDDINDNLSKAILDADVEIKDVGVILLDFIYGKKNVTIAAADIVAAARNSRDVESYLYGLSTQIQNLACEYPFLQSQLVSIVVSITQLSLIYLPSDVRPKFFTSFASTLGDTTQSNYGLLFEDSQRNSELIRNHISFNGFIARLLACLKEPANSAEVISGFSDALFILSTSLEGDHDSSHDLPNVDIPAAAQYMIHAGTVFYQECIKETGRDRADDSPLWNTRGKLWAGKPGLSRERWDFWKRRFETAAKKSDLEEETRKIANTTVQAMAWVEDVEDT